MICTNCGAPLPTGGQHCTVCGRPSGAAASGAVTPGGAPPAGPGPTPPPRLPNPPGSGPYGVSAPPYQPYPPGTAPYPPYAVSAPPYQPYPPGSAPYPPYAVSAPPYPPGTPYPPYAPFPVPSAPKRSRGVLAAAIAGGVVAAIALGVGAFALINTNGLTPAGATEPLWREYFIPARVGYTCTFESDTEFGSIESTSTGTQRVTAAESTSEGLRIDVTIETTVETDTGDPDLDIPPITTSQDLTYILADDGTVHAPGFTAANAGLTVRTSDFVVYPSIEDLRSGMARDSSVTAELEPDAASQAAMEEMLAPGESALTMRMELRVESAETTTITTPAGTYTDVIGVAVTFTDVEITNLAPGPEGEAFSAAMTEFLPETTTWFARGVGVVQTDVRLFTVEGSAKLTGCTG